MVTDKKIRLSDYTTIKLGGETEYFIECKSIKDITDALKFASGEYLPFFVLGGGSNVIFQDEGYKGVVIKNDLKGIEISGEEVRVSAGENWDEFVKICTANNLQGVECLSGIPGSVGATPVQNVGAYGQEVSDTITEVEAIDTETLEVVTLKNEECGFGYRTSIFKRYFEENERPKYIITAVTFRLRKNGKPEIRYSELKKALEDKEYGLEDVREKVIELRKRKSMVTDVDDANSVSCGSFFTNPIIDERRFEELKKKAGKELPFYESGDKYKIPAAWLIEQAGFKKGYTKNGAGISDNHSLALVNKGGSTESLLNLAREIEWTVRDKFGIELKKEPVVIA